MEKKCIKCDVVKSASEFNKTKNNRDGLHSICGDCLKEKAKTFIEANKYYLKQLRQINKECKSSWRNYSVVSSTPSCSCCDLVSNSVN